MRLSGEVAAEDVAEALRLFKVSTMAASETDDNNKGGDLMRGVKEAEREEYVSERDEVKPKSEGDCENENEE